MNVKNFLFLLLLASLWGPSFLFIKVAVEEIPPITLVLGRVGIAAIFLYLLLRMKGRNLPKPGRVWIWLVVVALFHNSLPFVLLSWGQQHIDSALASIVNGMTPIFTILLAHMLTSDDRLNGAKVVGVALGMAGLVLLVTPSLLAGVRATTLGLLAVVLVSASYGLAFVLTRLKLSGMKPLAAPTSQMILATLYLIPFALLIDLLFSLPTPSLQAIGSLLALAVLGTALAFIVYYSLLERTGASYVSMVTYLAPVFGVILGVLVLGERLDWNAYAGFALILLAVAVVNGIFKKGRRWLAWPGRVRTLAPGHSRTAGDSASPH